MFNVLQVSRELRIHVDGDSYLAGDHYQVSHSPGVEGKLESLYLII
jgi:hypothetical protein